MDTPLAIPEGHEECDALTEAGYAAYLPLGEVRSQCQTVEGHRQQRKHQETTLRQERIAVKLQDGDGALRFQVKWERNPGSYFASPGRSGQRETPKLQDEEMLDAIPSGNRSASWAALLGRPRGDGRRASRLRG